MQSYIQRDKDIAAGFTVVLIAENQKIIWIFSV